MNLPAGVPALMGYRLDGTPVGAVAFDDRPGGGGRLRLDLSAGGGQSLAAPGLRRAVHRPGGECTSAPWGGTACGSPPPDTEEARSFCREYGFAPAADGSGAWEKGIGYDPEFLGDGTAGA